MATYAIIDRSKRGPAAVLMIVDEREDAEAIAFELRRNHHDVTIIEVPARTADADENSEQDMDGE